MKPIISLTRRVQEKKTYRTMAINFCDVCLSIALMILHNLTVSRMDNDDIYDFSDDHEKLMTLLSNK